VLVLDPAIAAAAAAVDDDDKEEEKKCIFERGIRSL
jgi:hypothetical protein